MVWQMGATPGSLTLQGQGLALSLVWEITAGGCNPLPGLRPVVTNNHAHRS